jgi:uncharacterized phage-associated protein
MIRFLYNPKKAAQAAALLVGFNGGRMDLYALIKVLYLADRKALVDRGRPITGDKMVCMPYGPVLSQILDEAGSPEPNEFWRQYLSSRDNNSISLQNHNSPADELSEYERDVLKDAHDRYGRYSFADLKRYTHRLPEYADPEGSSCLIDPATILREEGWTDEEIQDARKSAREELFFAAPPRVQEFAD